MIDRFHPLVREWFASRYGEPTEPQVSGWPAIAAGNDVLISAPTGSGKTLAAFSICLDDLVRRAAANELGDHTRVVYVSPLKALTNDVRKNLELPLAELRALAQEQGVPLDEIRTAVRTGDTTAAERARMLKHPPHVLVTTPESLFILLTAEKSRALFTNVTTIIVDEIHAMARDKRGSHLALSLARLDRIAQT
ncbi:MAG: DEAD/DEAH box helicase, partial [Candidatus Aquilonibacter sp.]